MVIRVSGHTSEGYKLEVTESNHTSTVLLSRGRDPRYNSISQNLVNALAGHNHRSTHSPNPPSSKLPLVRIELADSSHSPPPHRLPDISSKHQRAGYQPGGHLFSPHRIWSRAAAPQPQSQHRIRLSIPLNCTIVGG